MVSASPKPKKAAKIAKKDHPPYAKMITLAIMNLKDRTGSSFPAIWKYMEMTFNDVNRVTTRLQLKRLLKEGYLIQVKNSFKLGKEAKKSAVSEAKKKERADKKASKPKADKKVTKPKAKVVKPKATKAKAKAGKKVVKPKAKAGKAAAGKKTGTKKAATTGRGGAAKKGAKAPGKSAKGKAIKKKGK